MRNRQGFTLIELMLVIFIIGILASIAFPSFAVYRSKAYSVEGLGLADVVRKNVLEYYEYRGVFPEDNLEAGLPKPDYIKGKYVESITVRNGAIDIRFNDNCNNNYKNKIMTLRPAIMKDNPTGQVFWILFDDDIAPGMTVFGKDNTNIVQ